ncbi:MAG: TolC family protein [Flavobacteriales bacterium]
MARAISYLILFLASANSFAQEKKWQLTEIIEYAWKNHPQINIGEAQQQNFAMREEQLKANRLPSVYFNGSENMNAGRSIDPFSYQFTNETIWSTQFSLNTSVNLFSGFQNNRNIEYNELQKQTQEQLVEKLKNDIALAISNQYLQVILLKEQITAIDTQLALTQRALDRETKLKAQGKSNDLKIKQVKAQLTEETTQRISLSGNEITARIQLKNQAMIPDEAFDIAIPAQTITNEKTTETVASLYAIAEKQQAVMKYQELNEKSKEANIEVAESSQMPSLTLNASLSSGYSSARSLTEITYNTITTPIGYLVSTPSEIVNGFISTPTYQQNNYPFFDQMNDNFSQFVGLNLRVPIFTQRGNKTTVGMAHVQYEIAKHETRQAAANLKRDIELALSQYEAARNNEQNSSNAAALQMEIYLDMQKLYKEGTTTLFELLSQKTRVFTSASLYIRNRYELIFRQLVLEYYKGNPIKL